MTDKIKDALEEMTDDELDELIDKIKKMQSDQKTGKNNRSD